uniref:IstB_IS21 domain-containing protein n=1 Tax=Caenorhabditis tropicalis TaxID=1561998 RepID=A0A1I7TTL7_9PELO
MMSIMTLNEKIRILESMRYRSKMEATLSLIRQKSYFDAEAVDFIIKNAQNSKIETVNDELEVEAMIRHRVHGMNPHKTFY